MNSAPEDPPALPHILQTILDESDNPDELTAITLAAIEAVKATKLYSRIGIIYAHDRLNRERLVAIVEDKKGPFHLKDGLGEKLIVMHEALNDLYDHLPPRICLNEYIMANQETLGNEDFLKACTEYVGNATNGYDMKNYSGPAEPVMVIPLE